MTQYVEVVAGEYKGWRGVYNGIVHSSHLQGKVASVAIASPESFADGDGSVKLSEVYLPIGLLQRMVIK